jgi:3D (Asp-Asp-Asp) domain-containing protein
MACTKSKLPFLLSFLLSLSAQASPVSEFSFPNFDSAGSTALNLWATYYYLPQMEHSPKGHPLRDTDGKSFAAALEHRDFCVAAMEGSVRIRQGNTNTVYNYAGRSPDGGPDCSDVFPRFPNTGNIRWRKAYGPFGDGFERENSPVPWVLVPFRSLAVDPQTIPFGTVLFIPQARGVRIPLPSGGTAFHDGYFIATDTGGAIKENHIDVFIGIAVSNPFQFIQSTPKGTFTAFVVKNQGIKKMLTEASIIK